MLRGVTSGTPSGPHFLSVLQHLLLIRDDYHARPQYFKLVDKCVSQIVLHKGGMDPDFHYTKKFLIDVDGIVGEGIMSMSVSVFIFPCTVHNVNMYTVEPLNNGHTGTDHFVHYREVALFH